MRPSHRVTVTLLGLLAIAVAARPAAGEDPGRTSLVKGLEPTVYDDTYAPGLELQVERGDGAPTLTYWASLGSFHCVPRRGEDACWRRIREAHGIPAEIPQPDCEEAIAAQPAILEEEADRSTQIAIHVRVPRLSRREATYLPDPPTCAAAP